MSDVYLIRADNGYFLRLAALSSEKTGLAVTGATVTGAVVEKATGAEVAGVTWPIDMPETGTPATYESAVMDAADFTDQTLNRRLRAFAVIDAGGVPGKLWAEVRFEE